MLGKFIVCGEGKGMGTLHIGKKASWKYYNEGLTANETSLCETVTNSGCLSEGMACLPPSPSLPECPSGHGADGR